MKGLFYIHSAITEKISKKVSENNHSESLFIEDYRYSSELENSIGIEEIYDLRPNDGTMSMWRRIKKGDKKIKKMMENSFHAYVHHVSYKEVQLIISNKMCKGHSVIEEGMDSYLREEVVEEKIRNIERSFVEKAKYMMRIGEKEFFRGDEEKYYAISKETFPGRKNKEVVDVEFGFGGKKREVGCILICESIKYWNKKETSDYIVSLIKALKMIKRDYEKVYYKIHPDSYGKWEERITKEVVREFGPASEEIDQSESTEDIAIGSGLDVFVYLSSVGLYCGMFSDSSVYSFHPAASETTGGEEEPRPESLQYVPDIYWDHVQPLRQRET